MKTNIIYSCSFIIFTLSLLTGCSDHAYTSHNESTISWNQKIETLNAQYSNLHNNSLQIQNISEINPSLDSICPNSFAEDKTKVVVASDLIGFGLGAMTGTLVGGAAGAVLLSYLAFKMQQEDTTAHCEHSLYDYGPEQAGNFTFVDLRDPIYPWTSAQPIIEELGMEFGAYHNFIITQMLTNETYILSNSSDRETIINNIFDIMIDYNLMDIHNSTLNLEEIKTELALIDFNFDDISSMWQLVDLNYDCIHSYYDIANLLNPAALYIYTNQFSSIIDEAWQNGELSLNDALLINGCVSVGYHSRLLWRSYLPDKLFTQERFVYDEINNEIQYLNHEELLVFLNNGHDFSSLLIGVPHFVNGNLAEVYFFNDNELTEYYGESVILQDRVISIDRATVFENVPSVQNGYLEPGEHMLLPVPGANNSVFYITNY